MITLREVYIYKIRNIQNNKVYIGSTVNLKKRVKTHRWALQGNYHANPHLQNAWNIDGELNFEFVVLETTDENSREEREQYWMDFFRSYEREFGYNICPVAGSPERRHLSEETKQKMAESHKGLVRTKEHCENLSKALKGRKLTEDHCKKLSESHKGQLPSEETLRKRSDSMKKHLRENPVLEETKRKRSESLKIYYFTNAKNNMKVRWEDPEWVEKMTQRMRGENNPMYGKPPTRGGSKFWIVTNPEGVDFDIKDLSAFCKENGLSYSGMLKVSKEIQKNHRGWIVRKKEDE